MIIQFLVTRVTCDDARADDTILKSPGILGAISEYLATSFTYGTVHFLRDRVGLVGFGGVSVGNCMAPLTRNFFWMPPHLATSKKVTSDIL